MVSNDTDTTQAEDTTMTPKRYDYDTIARRAIMEGDWPDNYTPDCDDDDCLRDLLVIAEDAGDEIIAAACRQLLNDWPGSRRLSSDEHCQEGTRVLREYAERYSAAN